MTPDHMTRENAAEPGFQDRRDDALDPLMAAHLSRELDPHLGRALAAFEREPVVAPLRARHPVRRRLFIGAAASGLIAASIAVAWALLPGDDALLPRPTQTAGAIHHPPPPPALAPAAVPDASPAMLMSDDALVEHVVSWRAVDGGPAVLGADIPVRQVRYEAVEEFEWRDPQRDITVRLTVPLEQDVLVRQTAF